MSGARLCALDDIPDGDAAGFAATIDGRPVAVFAVRQGEAVFVYENDCPHNGTMLDLLGTFLDPEGEHIECGSHSALFRIEDGRCIAGPCEGEHLIQIKANVQDGVVYIAGGT